MIDLTARVDWSAARDVVEGMSLAAEGQRTADDVLSSGMLHTVRRLLLIWRSARWASTGRSTSRRMNDASDAEPGPCLEG